MDSNDIFCLDLDGIVWTKSSYTANAGDCVERGAIPGSAAVAVRDSKITEFPTTRVSAAAWREFVSAAKTGRFVQA
ncbi:DUF397 domain-containing protein [Streptomyces sp. SID3343]|uniref:DUF397 domain-containing protein n=1 Tax=Streptomyces sp. SID3343 TaxID=2690260 RepID=UPI00136D07AE|nr:DUF397 domain-containing protein [Streptomyces sp. SID3343]MYV99703.1 DUF397 domain-containing protein [Streptomyces sp. SID3343]